MAKQFKVDIDLNGNLITDVQDPVSPQDAATKAYVDANASGGTVPFVGPTAPATPDDGDLWWDTDDTIDGTATVTDASTVNGIQASPTPQPDKLVPLDATGHFDPLTKKAAAASVHITTPRYIPVGAPTLIEWDSEVYDPLNMWDSGEPSKLVVPTGYGGLWTINAIVHFNGGSFPIRSFIYINGLMFTWQTLERVNGGHMPVRTFITVPLVAGDEVEVYADHGGGATLDLYHDNQGGGVKTRFEMIWQGAL